jgi:hypothetical protein
VADPKDVDRIPNDFVDGVKADTVGADRRRIRAAFGTFILNNDVEAILFSSKLMKKWLSQLHQQ